MAVDPTAAATARVQAYCRWHIAPSITETITVDGSGGYRQLLPTMRISALTAVVSDGTTLVEGTDFAWSADGYLDSLDPGTLFSSRPRSIAVTLTHGYDTMPDDVQQVIERVAARGDSGALRQVGQVAYATTPAGVGVGTSLTDFDKADLRPYRLPLVP